MDSTKENAAPNVAGRVAVIGGGLMGSGIAAVLILHGAAVTLVESTAALLEQGMERLRRRLERNLATARYGSLTISEAHSRITPTTDLSMLRNVEFVIEAITEKESDKKKFIAKTKCSGEHEMRRRFEHFNHFNLPVGRKHRRAASLPRHAFF